MSDDPSHLPHRPLPEAINILIDIKPYHCRTKTNTFKFSFFPSTAENWNVLPGDIRPLLLQMQTKSKHARVDISAHVTDPQMVICNPRNPALRRASIVCVASAR